MKICLAGKNSVAVNSLNYLLRILRIERENLLACINKNDNGVDTWQPSFLNYCKSEKIEIVELDHLYNINDLIFISLEYDRILKVNKFSSKKLFNIHFSLLPKYKGMYTSVLPILYGEKESGVTLHKIDDGIDTGDVIDQLKFRIDINDTARDVYFKYLYYGYKLLVKNIKNILEDNYIAKPQSPINSTYFSRNSINFQNIIINLSQTSYQIHNQIRAYIFEEYQLPKVNNTYIKRSILINEKIKSNYYEDCEKHIIISGIDGYKIILEKK